MTTGTKQILMAVMLGSALSVSAQSYYDDDIYYDASKAPKVETKVTVNRPVKQAHAYQVMPGSDAYTVVTSNTRDVDEYNRRGSYAAVNNPSVEDSLAMSDFKYTRKIEKFYNPEVVTGSGDEDLIYYYSNAETQSAPTQVNIYVDSPDYWNPYFYSSAWSWAWNRPVYMNPWYYSNPWLWDAWTWGPSFSWSWNWGPSWGWGPSFGWSWGWGAGWGPAYGWHYPGGWHNPGWHRPGPPAGVGASRPVRNPNRYGQPSNPMRVGSRSGVGSYRNRAGVRSPRPGRTPSSVGSARPSHSASVGNGVTRGYSTSRNPGAGNVTRPYNPSNASRPTGTYTPPQNRTSRNVSGNGSYRSNPNRSASTQQYNQNSSSRQNSYRQNPSSQGSYRSSGSSFGGGRSSGGSYGGGRAGGGAGGQH